MAHRAFFLSEARRPAGLRSGECRLTALAHRTVSYRRAFALTHLQPVVVRRFELRPNGSGRRRAGIMLPGFASLSAGILRASASGLGTTLRAAWRPDPPRQRISSTSRLSLEDGKRYKSLKRRLN